MSPIPSAVRRARQRERHRLSPKLGYWQVTQNRTPRTLRIADGVFKITFKPKRYITERTLHRHAHKLLVAAIMNRPPPPTSANLESALRYRLFNVNPVFSIFSRLAQTGNNEALQIRFSQVHEQVSRHDPILSHISSPLSPSDQFHHSLHTTSIPSTTTY